MGAAGHFGKRIKNRPLKKPLIIKNTPAPKQGRGAGILEEHTIY